MPDLISNFDSAATSNWHTGEKPDKRGIKTAAMHGIDISTHKAKQVKISDFDEFDLIVAMDKSNYSDLRICQGDSNDSKKIKLFYKPCIPKCNAMFMIHTMTENSERFLMY